MNTGREPMLEVELTQSKGLPEYPSDDIAVDSPIGSDSVDKLESTEIPATPINVYTRNLIIACCHALLGAFLIGWNIGNLNVPHDVIQQQVTGMNDGQWGLLNSMFCIGGMVGALVAGPVQDKYGRKAAMLVMDVIFVLSAAESFLYADNDLNVEPSDPTGYVLFWIGRFIVEIACGIALSVIPTYLGEISNSEIRGTIVTTFQLTICFAVIWANFVGYVRILGSEQNWPDLFLPNAVPLLQILTAYAGPLAFPESPKWFVQKGRHEEARKALYRLRMTFDIEDELTEITTETKTMSVQANDHSLLGQDALKHSPESIAMKRVEHDDCVRRKATKFGIPIEQYKSAKWAMIIAIVLMWMQQLSGINAIMYYTSSILADAGIISDKGKWLGTTAIMVFNFVAVFPALILVDRMGRRKLMCISAGICVVTSVLVSIVIVINVNGNSFWGYTSIVLLIIFVMGFELGLGPIPWTVLNETSPMRFKGTILSVATFMNWTGNLLIAQCSAAVMKSPLKLFPFSVATSLGICFILRFIPETKGKSAAEIRKALENI